jgi:DNA processing protein
MRRCPKLNPGGERNRGMLKGMNDPSPIDDRTRALALALTDRIGWTLLHRLLGTFGTLEAAFAATGEQLQLVQGIGKQIAANIQSIDLGRVAADFRRLDSQGIRVALWYDTAYPDRIKALADRPLALFWKGEICPEDAQAIAIVGTRNPSPRSAQLAYDLAGDLAAQGWTIVSGLARGIDTAAHHGALAAGGRTIAVLGCGVNVVYPPENARLAAQIAGGGALISEVHPDVNPSTTTLMRRNRLIAALSRATIVVEAPGESGALHAARSAHALGRPVFALDNSTGNAGLLHDFAHPLPEDTATLIGALTTS